MLDGSTIVGEAVDHDELVAVLRQRKAALQLSDALCDELAGMASGHTGKILGPAPVKRIGGVTLGPLLGALGLKLLVVVDVGAAKRMASRWQRRNETTVHPAMLTIRQARPVILSRAARKAAHARWADTTPEQRAEFIAMLNRARAAKRHARMSEAA
jgi:hypothetical protein